jgi:hypothetical protein
MIPKRSPRIVALLIAGTLVGALFASPALAAKPVKPGGTAPTIPEKVSPSTLGDTNYVLFDVTFTNTRSSSLQQVTLTDESLTDPDPVFAGLVEGPTVGGDDQGTCEAGVTELRCVIGTVDAGESVKLKVVYEVPITTVNKIEINFVFKSTGAPGSDPSTSHGDDYPVTGTINFDSSDYAGTYLFDASDLIVASNQALTKRGNPQSTEATGPLPGFPLTVEEVDGTYTCPANETCFGQWSVVSVNNGDKYAPGFFVVIGYDSVPGNANDVEFVHLVGPGLTPTFIRDECDADTLVNCIDSVDKMNGDLFFTLILDNNGPIRGI